MQQVTKFCVDAGRLYFQDGIDLKEVVAPYWRETVLYQLHDLLGHVGIAKLYGIARQYYVW